MSGEEIRFTRNGKEVKFEVGKKADNDFNKKDKKAFKPLFDAIVNSDGEKKISEEEFKMLQDLKTIFAKTGKNQGDATGHILDADDAKIAEEFANSGMNIKAFIAKKLAEVNGVTINKIDLSKLPTPEFELTKPELPEIPKTRPEVPARPAEVPQESKSASFNRSMQNLAKKFDPDELDFTQEVDVKKGMTIYGIAKKALQDEGVDKPNAKQINDRIAQIVASNPQVKDVNNVAVGTKIKVGKGTQQPQAVVEHPEGAPANGRGTGTVPVEKPTGGVVVNGDPKPESEEFTESPNAPAPEGVGLSGGTLKTYTKGTGEATATRYVYEKCGVKFEASNDAELKEKIKKFNDAVAEFAKTVENETAEAKQTRIQGAIDTIMGFGTESAVKFAQAKLAEQKANVTPEYYAEKTIAMLKSGNPALIAQMIGENGANFATLVNNNPAVQEAVGEVVKYLNDKFNNDEYLTLDEQAVKAALDKAVGKDGVSIAAKDAVAEEKDAAGNVTKAAEPEVFAKTMVTDKEGNSYYKSTASIGSDSVEFRAKNDKVLDLFLAELKAANDDAKKTALFKKYAETCTDPELLKSIVQQADKLKASAADVIALVNKSNLDVIYAMKTDHFEDTEADETTGTQASTAKTDVSNAIKARIEAIIANPELAKLPENAKYLDRVKGLELPAESTPMTKLPDSEGYTLTAGEEVTVKEGENAQTVTVKKYTKEGEPDVFEVDYTNPVTGAQSSISASSKEEVLKLKSDLEALALTKPAEGETLSAEQKRANLEKLIKIAELRPTDSMFEHVIAELKDDSIIDKNDPDAKALVQKLLLTRDAGVVEEIIKIGNNVDRTLFENDPVAFKTLAAMFKEIRDKENAGERLSKEEIALKNVLMEYVAEDGANIDHGNILCFDGDGNLAVYNEDCSGDNDGAVTGNSVNAERYKYDKVVNDPILSKDKTALATLAITGFGILSNEDQIKFINLESVDAEILSYIDLSNADQAVKDAYIAKAKTLFKYETPAEGQKLDPSNARYVSKILTKINGLAYPDDAGGAKKKADIASILNSFFTVTVEGKNQTTAIKDFRRFTYEEMLSLADAVANRGTEAQCKALAAMITPEEMEYGQFVRAIENQYNEGNHIDNAIREKYAEFVNDMTTKEEVFALIDKMYKPHYHIPFDTIMAKEDIGTDSEVFDKLISKFGDGSEILTENKEKLLAHIFKEDGTVDFDKYNSLNVFHLIPSEVREVKEGGTVKTPEVKMSETAKKAFEALTAHYGKDNIDDLESLYNKAKISTELQKVVTDRVIALIKENPKDSAMLYKVLAYFPGLATEIVKLPAADLEGEAVAKVKGVIARLVHPDATDKEAVIKDALRNGWLSQDTPSADAQATGKSIKDDLYAWGTRDSFWTTSKDTNKINKDTIVDVLDGFNAERPEKYKNEGIIECMRSDGVPKAITNRYIKALMRKAEELRLTKTNEFKKLVTFFDNTEVEPSEGDDLVTGIFRGSVHDNSDKTEYTKKQAAELDTMVNALLEKVKLWSRV